MILIRGLYRYLAKGGLKRRFRSDSSWWGQRASWIFFDPCCSLSSFDCMLRLSSFGRYGQLVSSIRHTSLPTIRARAAHLAVKQLPDTALSLRPNALRNPILKDSTMSPMIDGRKESFGNFDLVKRVKLDYTDLLLSKWQSRVTGLSVVHLDFEGEPN